MASTVLELRNVTKSYNVGDSKVHALKDVNMKLFEGEFVSIIGPSGSGKSTLLSLIGTLDVPTKGNIFVDGIDITTLSESKIARLRGQKIGFVFQVFNLYPSLSVYENIAMPMRIHEFEGEIIHERVTELISLVGLKHRVNHLPNELSGGERQRVAIARALATDPPIILADEPTGNLDTKTGLEILNLLSDLHKKSNKSIVIVTHDPDLLKYTDRTLKILDGKIVFDGPRKNIKIEKLLHKNIWGVLYE